MNRPAGRRRGLPSPQILIRDGDAKFGTPFNAALRCAGCVPKRPPTGSPLLNAFAERWVRSVKRECLDHFIAFNESHLNYLIRESVEHFHEERPHHGIGNRIPFGPRDPPLEVGRVMCRTRLGGVLRHFYRAAV